MSIASEHLEEEIDKLLVKLNEWKELARMQAETITRIEIDNKKLREALEKIAYHVGKFPTYESYCELKDKAREALKE
jgi:regulator of replication initiation timing